QDMNLYCTLLTHIARHQSASNKALRDAVQNGNLEEAGKIALALKRTGDFVGDSSLSAQAGLVIEELNRGHLEDATLDKICREANQLQRALECWLKNRQNLLSAHGNNNCLKIN
ncbi:MAG TPA: hypothetical protein VFM46_09985, partial [Pseudomonadales bacterium]|nr:hypothetical protein [Pseudomonadales bacterium]